MFDSTLNPLWQRYILAVQEEVKPALGCTEPISLALAAAVAAAELEGPVERVEAWVSPNLMKNGLGVTVPGTGFGEGGEGFVRLSYATSEETIREGLNRIREFVESLS